MKRIFSLPVLLITAFVALVALVIIVAVLSSDRIKNRTILKIELDGELHELQVADPTTLFSELEPLTTRMLARVIRRSAKDDRVIGLVLEVKNPSLGLAQLQEIEEAMAVFRKTGKWNVAFLESAGELSRGDGTYALAVTADEVVLAPPGDVNLVGLRAEVPFLRGTFDKLDIDTHVEQRYAYKNFANTFTEKNFTKEHREALVAMLDDMQTELVVHIAARRGVEPEVVRQWMAKGPHAATAAKKLGMVDHVAYWDMILDIAKTKSERDKPFLSGRRYGEGAGSSGFGGATIAMVIAEGQITRGESRDGFDEPSIGSDTVTGALRAAREADVKGILFRVDSPGGSYIASDVMRREVELTRAAGIPVVVSMGNVAASGGYFIAMDADLIIAQPGTITGSIGVLAGKFALRRFFSGFLGVTFDTYDTTEAAGIFSTLDLPSPEHKRRFAAGVDRIYKDFVTKAAAGRKKSFEDLHAVAQGRVWSGRAALAHGLVDELGGMQLAMKRVRELCGIGEDEKIRIQVYPRPKSSFELLIEAVGGEARMPAELRELTAAVKRAGLAPGDGLLLLPFVPQL